MISGYNSSIAKVIQENYLPQCVEWDRDIVKNHNELLITQGRLFPKNAKEMNDREMVQLAMDNWLDVVTKVEFFLSENSEGRVCIIGSYSGIKGSYNEIYAGAKAALHLYIETKKLHHPNQQIVGIAPSIIIDTKMTEDRPDYEDVLYRGMSLRRDGYIRVHDVIQLVHYLLYQDSGAICNVVIPMTGGI